MSKMGELVLEIQEEIAEAGPKPDFKKISKKVGVPIDWVRQAYIETYMDNGEYYDYEPEYETREPY
jgi:hypothetical protein